MKISFKKWMCFASFTHATQVISNLHVLGIFVRSFTCLIPNWYLVRVDWSNKYFDVNPARTTHGWSTRGVLISIAKYHFSGEPPEFISQGWSIRGWHYLKFNWMYCNYTHVFSLLRGLKRGLPVHHLETNIFARHDDLCIQLWPFTSYKCL